MFYTLYMYMKCTLYLNINVKLSITGKTHQFASNVGYTEVIINKSNATLFIVFRHLFHEADLQLAKSVGIFTFLLLGKQPGISSHIINGCSRNPKYYHFVSIKKTYRLLAFYI